MRRLRYTVVKNALANVVRGGASAIAALVIPHFLTHALDHEHFAAWSLLLQIAAYANYLDFGLQTAVARYLAQAIELGDEGRRDRLISTTFGLLMLAGVLVLAVLGAIIWWFPQIFHSVPLQTVSDLRVALVIMTATACIMLPVSTFTGVLIGSHRNEYPAIAIGGSRILGAIAVLVTVRYTQSLSLLALSLCSFQLLGGLAQYHIAERLLPGMRVRFSYVDHAMARELIGYCSTLTIWSFSMLLIGGLDVTIIGYFDFSAVAQYSLATTLISFFMGLSNSIFSALLAPVAMLQSRKEYERIRRLVTTSTRLNTYGCMALTVAAFFCGGNLLKIWVGPAYAAKVLPILEILLVAQTVRLTGSAYAVVLVALGLQRYGLFPAVVEGILNLALSVLGMRVIGAVGVAWATLIAAAVAIAMQVVLIMQWAHEIKMNRSTFAWEGIVQPVLAFSPLILWLVFREWHVPHLQFSSLGDRFLLVGCLFLTCVFVWNGLQRHIKASRFAG
ncbi:hypothetical protein H7849_21305 [Alloacidobacterium dinghuense]|uniref:Polysaccharide biosynthesis protein n=1 Tax=Alloacidobacterium dinghuense TaxID=2763107 RepID=A0A7G8BGB0_9BACT|nr:hypothetical protein [Alloacidobacterium dinghuense]QNI31580.1 hypothetical protein H7849_21305 [Alloacidobacterium dinghuense]